MNFTTIILIVIWAILIFIALVGFWQLKQNREKTNKDVIDDLQESEKNYQKKIIKKDNLPIDLEDNNDNFYFHQQVIFGNYSQVKKFNQSKNNVLVVPENSKKNLSVLFHAPYFNYGISKFIMINKSDLLVTDKKILLYHPLEPKTIKICEIVNIIFSNEKLRQNNLKKNYPMLVINTFNAHYEFLFINYSSLIKFVTCIRKQYEIVINNISLTIDN